MPQPLRVLIVEDSEEDATLLLQELRAGGYAPISERVETAEAMKAALHEQSWDLLLSDYAMPGFGGLEALKLLRESGLDLPFIIVSGKIGEMTAVETMKAGAHDYVHKYNLPRLIPVIQRAMREAAARQEQRRTEEALRESEERYRNLIESSHDLIQSVAPDGRFLYVNRTWLNTLGCHQDELPNLNLFDLIHPDFQQHCQALFKGIMTGEDIENIQVTFRAKDGRPIVLQGNATPRVSEGKVIAIQCFLRDITQRKQAEEALQRHSDTQAVINSLLRRSLENVPLDELLMIALDLVLSIPWLSFQSRGCIFLVEEDPEALVMKAQNGLAKPIQKVCGRVPFGRCLCGRAASTKEVQFSDCLDERHDITYEGMFPHGHYCVPILSARRVQGVMNLYLKEGHRREAKEEEFLRAIADVLAGITERKRAEEALRESEKKYRTLVTQSPDGIFIADLQGNFLAVNKAMCERLKYSEGEFLSMKIWDIVPEEYVDLHKKRLADILRGGAPNEAVEYTVRGKDGEMHCVEVLSTPYFRENEVIGFQGIARDITARKRAEEAIRDSEERYRAIMEQSPDGIFLTDVETKRILEANLAFAQMLGCTTEEIRGLSIYDTVAADREDIDQRFQERVNGKGPSSYERQYRKKDGSLVEVWVSFSLISYGGRKVMCALVRDLTEKKALEAQFLRAQRMESIGLLAGGIAHDLNNILAPILMNVELLQRELPDHKPLSSIASSAQRGAEIVKQILTFSRGMEGERLLLSPKHLLKEMERFLKETFPKSMSIEVEIPNDLWPLSGDATQLHQVLMNLCINARDAMPQGGILTLSVRNLSLDEAYAKMYPEAKVGPHVLLSVSDTGKGIPPEHLDRIFDPFFTTKERGKGTGLGLPTVRAIVKGHGGFINVYSKEGKGTKFHVYLPASPSAEVAKAEEERATLHTGKGEFILVVEDEASIREITQMVLESYGYQVISASDGSEAAVLYAQHRGKIQAVLTDMAMPVMDGAATIRALRKIDPAVKIIATSGMDAEKMVAEARGLAVQAFLQKPFTAERLLRTVVEVLKG